MLIRRESRTGANDLNTVYRPCTVDEMLGNETNMNIIRKGLEVGDLSHTFLFTGDPGCGKTTAARIIALGLNCEESDHSTSKPCLQCRSCTSIINMNSMDVLEINVGKSGGKDAVDKIVEDLPSSPFYTRYKVIIFDEAHKLTPAAQDLLLKVVEDGYSHCYFIFCTNEPEKLNKAFLTRCNVLNFGRVSESLIFDMLDNVSQFEGFQYSTAVIRYIAEESRGVPRTALMWLKKAADEGTWTMDAAKAIAGQFADGEDPKIIEISRALIKGNFKEACGLYDKIKSKTQAETVRLSLFAYFTGCLKRAKNFGEGRKFSRVLNNLEGRIFETGRPGDNRLYHLFFKVVDELNQK